jgi:hypothetical protein
MSFSRIATYTTGAGAVSLGSYLFHERMSKIVDKNDFIGSGLAAAGMSPETQLSYFSRRVHVDNVNNVAFASVTADNRRVLITAKRDVEISKKFPVSEVDYFEDDLDARGSGIAFYWENPWEIKASAIRGFHSAKNSFVKYSRKTKASIIGEVFEDNDEEHVSTGRWILTSVTVDDKTILGNQYSHPEIASRHFAAQNGQKSEYSVKRAKIVLSVLVSLLFLLGARRTYLNRQMKPGFTFARQFILSHPSVQKFYENKPVEIISRTGEFKPKKIDAEITIGCREDAVEGIVKFGASKHNDGWMVNTATFTPNGAKPIDLLVRTK